MQYVSNSKEHIDERFAGDLQRFVTGPQWTISQKLALACRIIADDGQCSGLAGQITIRSDAPAGFWTIPFARGFDEVTADEVLLVDNDFHVVDDAGMVNPGNRFHLWIYRVRPDVKAIVHTHAPYAAALSMIGVPLAIAHMDAMRLYENVAYLREWPGVPNGDEEGRIISTALGSLRCILLAHHGLLTTGRDIEEATVLAVAFEKAAKNQLLAMAAGSINQVDPDFARKARENGLNPKSLKATFDLYARRCLKKDDRVLGNVAVA